MIYLIKGQDTPHTNPAHYVLAQNWRKTGAKLGLVHGIYICIGNSKILVASTVAALVPLRIVELNVKYQYICRPRPGALDTIETSLARPIIPASPSLTFVMSGRVGHRGAPSWLTCIGVSNCPSCPSLGMP